MPDPSPRRLVPWRRRICHMARSPFMSSTKARGRRRLLAPPPIRQASRSRLATHPAQWRSPRMAGRCASRTRWGELATQARLGMTGEARARLGALDDERANAGEVCNARAVICLAEGNPAAALAAVQDVARGSAPVIGYLTLVETHLLAGVAHRQLGNQRTANQAAEPALRLAGGDRPALPFAMTGSPMPPEALPRH